MLIPSHLLRPRALPYAHIPRERLVGLLQGLEYARVIALEAPGGYGKSTVVAEFAQRSPAQFAWLPLQLLPVASPLSFTWNLVKAIQMAVPGFGRHTDFLHEETMQSSWQSETEDRFRTTLLPAVTTELSAVDQRLILVLEDYHALVEPGIHEMVSSLIEQCPDNVQLVVLSRQPPSWPGRARWAGQDLLVTISSDQLAFTPSESRSLAIAMGVELTPAQSNQIHASIGGWPILHHLVYTYCRGRRTDQVAEIVQLLVQTDSLIYDYLSEELLNKQPPSLRDFLCRTSILHRLNPETCNALLSTGDAEESLKALSGTWFLSRVGSGAEQSYFHSHDIVRDFLRLVLRREYSSDSVEELYTRLGRLLEAQGNWEQAIASYSEGECYGEASRVIKEQARALIDASRAWELSVWFKRIPQGWWEQDPTLLVYLSIALANNDQPLAAAYLLKAQDMFERSEQHDQALWAQTELGWVYFLQQRYLACLETLLSVKKDPSTPLWVQPRLLHHLAIAMLNAGELDQAAILGEQSIAFLRKSENGSGLARVLRFVASVYERQGQLEKAISRLQEARRWTDALNLGTWSLAWISNQLAVMHLHLGQLEQARLHADEADHLLDRYRQLGSRSPLLDYVRIVQGHVYRETYDYERAEELYRLAERGHPNGVFLALRLVQPGREREALELAQERYRTRQDDERPIQRAKNRCLLGVAYLSVGNYSEAQFHLEAAEAALAQRNVLYELTTLRLYLAKVYFLTDRRKEAVQHLCFVLAQMSSHGYFGLDIWQPWVIAELCANALRVGIEQEFVESLATKRLTPAHMNPFLALVNDPEQDVRARAIRIVERTGDTFRLAARQVLDSCSDQRIRIRMLGWLETGWLTEIGLLRLKEFLSWREMEVFLLWISAEHRGSVMEIAAELVITPDTVNTHLKKVRETFEDLKKNGLISFDLSGKGANLEAYDWAVRNSIINPRAPATN